jgi:flagellar protein FlbD
VSDRQTHISYEIQFTMRKAPRSHTSSASAMATLGVSFHKRSPVILQSFLLSTASLPMRALGEVLHMIELTRLNGSPLAVNCDLIKYAEAAPDTVLTLITGEKLVVLERCSEVTERTLEYRSAVLRKAWPEAAPSVIAKSAYDADQRVREQERKTANE